MNAKQIKQRLNIEKLLAHFGQYPDPQKSKGDILMFKSPIRIPLENDSSFKVLISLDIFYDHGTVIGGDLIKLACILFGNCSISEALEKLSNLDFSNLSIKENARIKTEVNQSITVIKHEPITLFNLIQYIKHRKVPFEFVKQYASQIEYSSEKIHLGLGIPNIANNGWEIHTPLLNGKNFKCSTSPKSVSFFKRGKADLAVFEGMFSFFSLPVFSNEMADKSDYLLLNSVKLKEQAAEIIARSNYTNIHLFLDNDESGKATSSFLLGQSLSPSLTIKDNAGKYKESNDLNDFVRGIKTEQYTTEAIFPSIDFNNNHEKRNKGMSM